MIARIDFAIGCQSRWRSFAFYANLVTGKAVKLEGSVMSGQGSDSRTSIGDTIEETFMAAILGIMTLVTFANVVHVTFSTPTSCGHSKPQSSCLHGWC